MRRRTLALIFFSLAVTWGVTSALAQKKDETAAPKEKAAQEKSADKKTADLKSTSKKSADKKSAETESAGKNSADSARDNAPPGDDQVVVDYQGRLQDDKGQPISGIFHFDFKLYEGEDGPTPLWQERQYVAVVDGAYTVALGEVSPLKRADLPKKPWIAIDWVGEGEVLRDEFQINEKALAATQPPAAGGSAGPVDSEVTLSEETRALLDAAKKGKQITFADVAERAVAADSANTALNAERLGDMSADELKRATQLALDRLGEHIADPDAHAATGGLGLGSDRAVQKRIGGDGGDPYQVNCPPGYVVTGIKGGAGRMIDSISIVCSQLR